MSRIWTVAWSGLILAACCAPPPPEAFELSADPDRALADAYRLHLAAVGGDASAGSTARAMLEKLQRRRPDDPRVLAWLGSARLLQARDAMMPWKKGEYATAGLELLDSAVDACPDDVELRFLRGISSRELPGFFGRADQAREDLEFARRELEEARARSLIDPELGTWIAETLQAR